MTSGNHYDADMVKRFVGMEFANYFHYLFDKSKLIVHGERYNSFFVTPSFLDVNRLDRFLVRDVNECYEHAKTCDHDFCREMFLLGKRYKGAISNGKFISRRIIDFYQDIGSLGDFVIRKEDVEEELWEDAKIIVPFMRLFNRNDKFWTWTPDMYRKKKREAVDEDFLFDDSGFFE